MTNIVLGNVTNTPIYTGLDMWKRKVSYENGEQVLFTLNNVYIYDMNTYFGNSENDDKCQLVVSLGNATNDPITPAGQYFINTVESIVDTLYKEHGLEIEDGLENVPISKIGSNTRKPRISPICSYNDGKEFTVGKQTYTMYINMSKKLTPVLRDGILCDPNLVSKTRANIIICLDYIRGCDRGYLSAQIRVCSIELPSAKPIKQPCLHKPLHDKILESLIPSGNIHLWLRPEICETLLNCGAWISGSFLLQVLHDEKYQDSDIDIFCPSNRVSSLLEFFFNNELKCEIKKIYGSKHAQAYIADSINIENVMNISWANHNIQIISVDEKDVSAYIDNTFDFSFCKIRWNGEVILPTNLTDIENKKGTYNVSGRSYKCMDRMKKYNARGYKIVPDYSLTQQEINIL